MGGTVVSLDKRARHVDKETDGFELDSEDEEIVIPAMVSIQHLPAETHSPVAESEHVSTATYQSKGKRRKKAKSTKSRRKKPQADDETSYRHLSISLKRKSCESMNVGGDELKQARLRSDNMLRPWLS